MAVADTEMLIQMFMYTHSQAHKYICTNSNAIFILWFDFKLYTDVNIINIYTQKNLQVRQ